MGTFPDMLEVCALSEVFTTPSLLHDQTDHRYRQLLIESRSHKLRAVELLTLAQFRAGGHVLRNVIFAGAGRRYQAVTCNRYRGRPLYSSTVGTTAAACPAKNAAKAPSSSANAPNNAPRETVLAAASAASLACSFAFATISLYCC